MTELKAADAAPSADSFLLYDRILGHRLHEATLSARMACHFNRLAAIAALAVTAHGVTSHTPTEAAAGLLAAAGHVIAARRSDRDESNFKDSRNLVQRHLATYTDHPQHERFTPPTQADLSVGQQKAIGRVENRLSLSNCYSYGALAFDGMVVAGAALVSGGPLAVAGLGAAATALAAARSLRLLSESDEPAQVRGLATARDFMNNPPVSLRAQVPGQAKTGVNYGKAQTRAGGYKLHT